MELNGKRVLVVGLGKSGVASALFLKKHGAKVSVSDTKSGDELRNEIPVLLDNGIAVETGGHGERTFRGQDLIVVSPGVPVDAPPLQQARAMGEAVIGEIELAAQFLPGPIVAITGSNGKTTTTTLAGEIMTAGGFATLVGGNIGTPAISLTERANPETVIVLEVSSFQLETIQTFRPKVAVVLNVTPDHLDRHRTFEIYVNAKTRLFENQQTDDFAVLNADDKTCVAMANRTKAQVFWFSRQREVERGAWVRDGKILFRDADGQREILQVSDIPLKGAHNLENVLAAVCSGVLMGCAPEKIRDAVKKFKAVEHRLEFVATIRGVGYYNDSKATNVDATIKALESFPGEHPPHSRRERQRQRLHPAEPVAARSGQARVYDWRGCGQDRIANRLGQRRRSRAGSRRDFGERPPQSQCLGAERRRRPAGPSVRQLRPVQKLRTSWQSLQRSRPIVVSRACHTRSDPVIPSAVGRTIEFCVVRGRRPPCTKTSNINLQQTTIPVRCLRNSVVK